jgi:hypothetical protein
MTEKKKNKKNKNIDILGTRLGLHVGEKSGVNNAGECDAIISQAMVRLRNRVQDGGRNLLRDIIELWQDVSLDNSIHKDLTIPTVTLRLIILHLPGAFFSTVST